MGVRQDRSTRLVWLALASLTALAVAGCGSGAKASASRSTPNPATTASPTSVPTTNSDSAAITITSSYQARPSRDGCYFDAATASSVVGSAVGSGQVENNGGSQECGYEPRSGTLALMIKGSTYPASMGNDPCSQLWKQMGWPTIIPTANGCIRATDSPGVFDAVGALVGVVVANTQRDYVAQLEIVDENPQSSHHVSPGMLDRLTDAGKAIALTLQGGG